MRVIKPQTPPNIDFQPGIVSPSWERLELKTRTKSYITTHTSNYPQTELNKMIIEFDTDIFTLNY